MKRLALSLIALFLLIGDASAASKFWVGGGTNTNWDASPTTNWANTSGGAGNQTAPTTGDSVFFDGNSGTGAAVWNVVVSLIGLNCTGSKNIVSHTANAVITLTTGNLILPTGVGGTYTATVASAQFTFAATSGTQQITTNGFKPGNITLNGVGGTFQLQDNLAMLVNAGLINLTAGTWDSQSFTVNTPIFSSANGTLARAMIGSGAYTVGTGNATGVIWAITSGGTLTISSFTSNINITGTTASTRQIQPGTMTWIGSYIFGPNTAGGSTQILGINTFGGLQATGPLALSLTNTSLTLGSVPIFTASTGNEIYLTSNVLNTQRGLVVSSGAVSFTWAGIRDIAASGGATFAASSSFNLGNNSGISFSNGGSCIIGGWLLWRDMPAADELPEIFDREPANDNSPAFLGKTG